MPNNQRRVFIKNIALLSVVSSVFTSEKLIAAGEPTNQNKSKSKERDLVFLFQGDSITDGNRTRNDDLNNNTGHGYVFSIASRVGADFPDRNLKFINRGNSGSDINSMADRWQHDTLDNKPDVLSILIGINDSNGYLHAKKETNSVSAYEATYRRILDQVKATNPDITLVLCEPFTLPYVSLKEQQTSMQADVMLRQDVVKKLAVDYNAVFVPFQDVFNKALERAPEKYWIWDNVHPTVAGHELLAREWLKCVSKKIKFLKKEV
jgi:lysophospholipase L1-like esterase